MQMKIQQNSSRFSSPFTSKTGRAIVIAGTLGFIGCIGLSLFAIKALGRPADFRAAMKLTGKGKPKPSNPNSPAKNRGLEGKDIVENTGSRHSLEFYTKGVRESMFSAPQPAPPEKPKSIPVVPPPPPPKIVVPVIVPVEVNPFADWVYTGTVTIGETKMVLIENSKTREGHYLKLGEMFQGAQVSQVTDQTVSFLAGSKLYLLAKSDNVNLVPLDRNAGAPITSTGQSGQPAPTTQTNAPPMFNTNMPVGMPTGLNFGGGSAPPEIIQMMKERAMQAQLPGGAVMSEAVILK